MHAISKVCTYSLDGQWLVFRLVSQIRARGGKNPLQNLISFFHEVTELEEELEQDNPALPSNEKEVTSVKTRARVRRLPHMPLFKCLLVLSRRRWFNALLLQPPPLPVPLIMLLFLLIVAQPSHRCLARGRPLTGYIFNLLGEAIYAFLY